ncbi:DUF2059 domain-containing protein [Undibacterium sp. Di27W]|uniref:DUF2059 domain-containing protein n=1 Tax=Undibacterium sp. Di27W TaxID=3413036 RepID=UPI003BF38CFB
MKRWSILLFVTLLASASAYAEKPTQASVKELLVLTNSQQMLKSIEAQMDGMMKSVMTKALKDKGVTAEQQAIMDKFRDKVILIHREEMTWEKLEPVFIEIYSNSLTQEDVDGISAFYKSPAGKSFVSKMPGMMQQSMSAMQQKMAPMMDKILSASKVMEEDMQKLEQKK